VTTKVKLVQVHLGKIDLEPLSLSSGQARSLALEVPLEPASFGGQTYDPEGGSAAARLDVSRTTAGYALRLRFDVTMAGPCVRCLERARFPLRIDSREVDQPAASDEELTSPYVSDGEVDVQHWANDAVVLEMPNQPLCREDCAGLCAVCGDSLNDADPEAHRHDGGGDPRMAKLKDLRLE
jgi:uncharacterized protein